MLDDETLEHLRAEGIPESDIAELDKFAKFLKARKEYKEAKDEGRVTKEMKREYIRMIDDLTE